MKKSFKDLFPLVIDYSLAVIAAGSHIARKVPAKHLLPFLVEIGFHTLFHLGSKGILTVVLTRKGRGAGIKALQWAFIVSKPVIQQAVLKPIFSSPKFHQASQSVERFCHKTYTVFTNTMNNRK